MNGLPMLPWLGGVVTLVGFAAGVLRLFLFGNAFMTPSSQFFADPHGTMDSVRQNSFIGIVLLGGAGAAAPLGVILLAIGLVLRSQKPRLAAR